MCVSVDQTDALTRTAREMWLFQSEIRSKTLCMSVLLHSVAAMFRHEHHKCARSSAEGMMLDRQFVRRSRAFDRF